MASDFWLSGEEVQAACRAALHDTADHLVGDVINHADIKCNLPQVARRLKIEIENGFYEPASLLEVEVPETRHSVKPVSIIYILDLIAVYAAITKLTPHLDSRLSPNVLSYRWRPGGMELESAPPSVPQPGKPARELVTYAAGPYTVEDAGEYEVNPAGWLPGRSEYLELARKAAQNYRFCAKTGITAFFENICVKALHDHVRAIVEEVESTDALALRDAEDLLFRIYKSWAWEKGGEGNRASFLPQGNYVSKFLANFALLEFDRAMDTAAVEDPTEYIRFADDIIIFTKKEDQARRALLACERFLRESGFDLRSEKTQLMPANELFDEKADKWLRKMGDLWTGGESAREFLEKEFPLDDVDNWGRLYFQALDVLRERDDDFASGRALQMFLDNPAHPFLAKNYQYLKHFAADHSFAGAIVIKLARRGFTFPLHRYYLYRLAAYSREYSPALKEIALQDALDASKEWYWRVGALCCLNSFDLGAADREKIAALTEDRANPAVVRAALVTSWQQPVVDLGDAVKDLMYYYNVGHCEYLPAYFFRVATEPNLARALLAEIRDADVYSPDFVDRLHQLDLLKNNGAVREEFLKVVDEKMSECDPSWTRLIARLEGIKSCPIYEGV
ncbi:MAG: hypothetical protein GTN49_05770 [candidate division Zixibacteria bacterium]|nr:hypothetical protein [candidate division Zixibacteria bacterium]